MSRPVRAALAALAPAVLASPAHACAVCFGAASQNLVKGFFWGILLLLLLPFLLMGTLVGLIVYHTRKHRLAHPH